MAVAAVFNLVACGHRMGHNKPLPHVYLYVRQRPLNRIKTVPAT